MTNNREDLKAEAEQLGLTNLNDHHLTQLAKAKAAAARMVNGIPRDLHAYNEPAHVYRASEEA